MDLYCPSCGKNLPDHAVFCAGCGAPIKKPASRCPSCGEEIKPGARFCGICGAVISEAGDGSAVQSQPTLPPQPYEKKKLTWGSFLAQVLGKTGKAFLKSLPLSILFFLVSLAVHTYLLVGVNQGFSPDTLLGREILASRNNVLSATILWTVISTLIFSALIFIKRKGIGELIKGLIVTPKQILAYIKDNAGAAPAALLTGAGLALLIAGVTSKTTSLTLAAGASVLFATPVGRLAAILVRNTWNSIWELFGVKRKQVKSCVLIEAYLNMAGTACAFVLAIFIPWDPVVGLIFLGIAAALMLSGRNQGGSPVMPVFLFLIALTYFIGDGLSLLNGMHLLADDGGVAEAGGWDNWLGSQGSYQAVANGVLPALGFSFGLPLANSLGAIDADMFDDGNDDPENRESQADGDSGNEGPDTGGEDSEDQVQPDSGPIYDQDGYDQDGYDRNGFHRDGYDENGYDVNGYDKNGYDKDGYNRYGVDMNGYDRDGFDYNGYDRDGCDREGFNNNGIDRDGYNRDGFDAEGYDRGGYDRDGFDYNGYDKDGYNRDGFDSNGYDRDGFDQNGIDSEGYDRDGFDSNDVDREGYNRDGFNDAGYDRDGYDKDGYDQEGYDRNDWGRDGFNRDGYDQEGYNREGYNDLGYNREGYDRDGYDMLGYDKEGYNEKGYNREGCDRDGFGEDGFNEDGWDRNGRNRQGYDRNGMDVNGLTREQNLDRLMDEMIKQRRGEKFFVRNPDLPSKFWNWTFGGVINEGLGDWRGGQCGEFGKWGAQWMERAIKDTYGDDVTIDVIVLQRNALTNHAATLVIKPNGERLVLDFWDGMQTGNGQVMTEKEWLDKWNEKFGEPLWGENVVTQRSSYQDMLTDSIKRMGGDAEKGIEDFMKGYKPVNPGEKGYTEYQQALLTVKSYRREPWELTN